MDFVSLLALATAIIQALGPVVGRIVDAIASGRDPVVELAAEEVGTILPEQGHLAAAIALAHANRAAEHLRQAHANGETDGMTPAQLAYVEHALAVHALVTVGS